MISSAELARIPLFAELAPDLLALVARSAEDVVLRPGEFVAHEGDERALFVVVEGEVNLIKEINGVERVIGPRGPGELYGEVPVMLNMNLPASCVAVEPSRVLRIDVQTFFTLAAAAPTVAAAVGALAQGRISGLRELAAEPAVPEMTLVAPQASPQVHRVQTFLDRNRVRFETVNTADPAHADEQRVLAGSFVVRLADGSELVDPTLRDVAAAGGLAVAPAHEDYDVVVVGAGPTGLTAAVNGAAEGLRTLVVERFAPGGQAGTSTRIENYTGFPFGVSGDELATKALRQARRLGAEIVVTRDVESLDPDAGCLMLDGDIRIRARVVLLASGVEWRQLAVDGIDRFVGNGVYYGAARSDTGLAHGRDVLIIGAGNSAGQAALFFSRHSRSVTMLVRGESLASSMSHYLMEQIRVNSRISVETRSEVAAVHGTELLESVDVVDRRLGGMQRRDASVMFVMIGADARTGWLPDAVARDVNGYVLTGLAARESALWRQARDPFALETTAPGVFAAGDVRAGSVKRVASGVGEGGMAIAFVHQYLARLG
ncbi:FAD-dependent oxidoreductase [Motilibacter aurantiacus]|uniref:FAD-dependent oxidoreductase n=1 Tax=Motilibacter aurantiacus TaxID=2714955 RepID=UPI00140984D7|nr:FAD-dependent oxidoreductase [Motilibacter aurantiacus]